MTALVRPDAVVTLVLRSGHPAAFAGTTEVLAVTRRGRHDDWNLPGGKIDPGETPRVAAMRELLEETGVVGRGLVRCHQSNVLANDGMQLVWAYLVAAYEGEPRPQENGINVGWWTLDRIVSPASRFRAFNRILFAKLGLL